MALGYRQYQTKLWKTRLLLGVLLIACVLVAVSVVARFKVEREMAERRQAVEREYEALKERHVALEQDVEYLKDERSLEAEIRKHFDVAKEGESVIILMDEPERATVTPVVTPEASRTYPWWQFWR